MTLRHFRDYIRAEHYPPAEDLPLPAEKIVHMIRPSRSGGETHGLRTLCGIGQRHRVWRVSIAGAATNGHGDGWAICVACVQRSKAYRIDDA